MTTTLVAYEQPLSKIFSNDFVLSIPGYQRPYAWTKDQAQELFDDLTRFMRGHAGLVANLPPYFLGSIVLIKASDSTKAEVVDGQQRLTTLTLLLSALRANMPKAQAAEVTQLIYEKGSTILATTDHFRLTLRALDREFFKTYVQLEDGFERLIALDKQLPDAQRRMHENAVFFQGCLRKFSSQECMRLAEFIVTRCYLVAVSTPDQESAFRIFSVLNSRGLDLSATDILKADIIGKLSADQQSSYTEKWENAEEDLGRDGFVSLFGHIRMIYRKAKPQGTLLSEFREHVSKGADAANLVDSVILPMAAVFDELVQATYTSQLQAEYVNESLKWLGRPEFSDWVPPAIAFSVRYRNQPLMMRSFLADLERIGYSMLVRRIGANDRIERFSRLTQAVEEGVDLANENSPLQLTLVERQRTLEALNGRVYENMPARACALLLVRLDALVGAEGVSHDYSVLSVEHVLPQNPKVSSKWMAWFPDNEQREALTNKLGNLALLSRRKNSAAQNFEFEKKKTAYFMKDGVVPFALTTQVLQHSTWNPTVVEARQAELIRRLSEQWRLH